MLTTALNKFHLFIPSGRILLWLALLSTGATTKLPTCIKRRTWLISNWATSSTLLKASEDMLCVRGNICLICFEFSREREGKQNNIFILKEFGRLYLATCVTNEHFHVYDHYCIRLRKKCYFSLLLSPFKVANPLGEIFYATFNLLSFRLFKLWSWTVPSEELMNPL